MKSRCLPIIIPGFSKEKLHLSVEILKEHAVIQPVNHTNGESCTICTYVLPRLILTVRDLVLISIKNISLRYDLSMKIDRLLILGTTQPRTGTSLI